jgi:hypothetical protein
MFPVLTLALGLQLTLPVADTVPKLDVEPSCAAAAVSGVDGRTKQGCLDSEDRARAQLQQRWTEFSTDDRTRCTGMTRTGGPASYVELLTCLELADAAGKLKSGTTGAAGRL